MRLIMAVSKDGFVAQSATDPMLWTGHEDKTIFKLLTLVGDGQQVVSLAAGLKTWRMLPRLPGRQVIPISRRPTFGAFTLQAFERMTPNGWLIGGQTVALAALEYGMLKEAHISVVPTELGEGIADELRPAFRARDWMHVHTTQIGQVELERWVARRRNG